MASPRVPGRIRAEDAASIGVFLRAERRRLEHRTLAPRRGVGRRLLRWHCAGYARLPARVYLAPCCGSDPHAAGEYS